MITDPNLIELLKETNNNLAWIGIIVAIGFFAMCLIVGSRK
jgi:hypothetical protein